MVVTEREPVVPVPKSQITHDINDEVNTRWNRRWRATTSARQSRTLWPIADKNRSKQLLLCDRQEFGDLIRLFTGHNHLNRHKFLLEETDTEDCRFCRATALPRYHLQITNLFRPITNLFHLYATFYPYATSFATISIL